MTSDPCPPYGGQQAWRGALMSIELAICRETVEGPFQRSPATIQTEGNRPRGEKHFSQALWWVMGRQCWVLVLQTPAQGLFLQPGEPVLILSFILAFRAYPPSSSHSSLLFPCHSPVSLSPLHKGRNGPEDQDGTEQQSSRSGGYQD